MSKFSEIWDTEVKQLAINCIAEPRLVEIMGRGEEADLTEEENEYLDSVVKNYKDIYGMYYISHMIWQVEHSLADGRDAMASLAVFEIYTVLDQPSYFQDVFKGDENDEEWKTRAALRDGLRKLINA